MVIRVLGVEISSRVSRTNGDGDSRRARARGHRRALPGQDCRLKEEGDVDGRRAAARVPGRGPQACRCRCTGLATSVSPSYFIRLVRLSYLAPGHHAAILD